ncbi:hypothetical protein [Okeania sp. SIO1I7]|nr:hypothetical protein [Okeania sp. SIO1I7]NET25323.1 hypothetical protein [Okeania sp. SIO1I7]
MLCWEIDSGSRGVGEWGSRGVGEWGSGEVGEMGRWGDGAQIEHFFIQ